MLVLTIALFGVFFVIHSLVNAEIAETMVNENKIQTEVSKEDSLSSMEKSVEENELNSGKLTGYIIPANSVSEFIQTLDNIVSSSGLKSQIGSIAYQSSASLSAVNAELLDVKITVEGSWSGLHFFLQLLETYPLKINIENVSLKQTDETIKGAVPQWSGDIEFTVLKFKDN